MNCSGCGKEVVRVKGVWKHEGGIYSYRCPGCGWTHQSNEKPSDQCSECLKTNSYWYGMHEAFPDGFVVDEPESESEPVEETSERLLFEPVKTPKKGKN
jgi:NAD-dependent SIR2 family protein deacetylase